MDPGHLHRQRQYGDGDAQSVCGIRASQAGNAGISAAPQILRLMSVTLAPVLVGAASRKVHGSAGTFNWPLAP